MLSTRQAENNKSWGLLTQKKELVHVVKENPANHGATQEPSGAAHKYQRQAADVSVHVLGQILKCGSQDSNTQSLRFKTDQTFLFTMIERESKESSNRLLYPGEQRDGRGGCFWDPQFRKIYNGKQYR